MDISEIVERDTQPGTMLITILCLSTHDYWPNLSTEYKRLKNMIVQSDEDEIKRTISPYQNYNWVMEHYLESYWFK